MTAENTSPFLQYLRIRSERDEKFEARLALAIHRQSTSSGFLGSLEGGVMGEADTWIALIVWAEVKDAERSSRELFESDYHAGFAERIAKVEANRLFTTGPGIIESLRGSRYARFARIEHFDPPADFSWPAFLVRRRTELEDIEGFEELFTFKSRKKIAKAGFVSTWNDGRLLRAAAKAVEAKRRPDDLSASAEESLRITSTNLI